MNGSRHRILESPTGPFYLVSDGAGIRTGWLRMLDESAADGSGARLPGRHDPSLLGDLGRRILAAMSGRMISFDDVELPQGTPFQRRVWRATRKIPHGSTRTYGLIAADVGRPGSSRAVGQAMRRNSQPIITPCHRVVSSGDVGGFGGEGREGPWGGIKTFLLRSEGVVGI